jgi:hypothetical protein
MTAIDAQSLSDGGMNPFGRFCVSPMIPKERPMVQQSEPKTQLERTHLSFGGSSSAARILNALTFALRRRSIDTADRSSSLPRPSPSSWRGRHTQPRVEEEVQD